MRPCLLVCFLLLVAPKPVFAQASDVFDAVQYGRDVVIEGQITGDVIAVGRTVTIGAEVDGDVIAVGGYVTVTGTARAIYVLGGSVDIDSNVREGVTIASLVARLRSPAPRAKLWTIIADVSSDIQSLRSQSVETIVRGHLEHAQVMGRRLVWGQEASISGILTASPELSLITQAAVVDPSHFRYIKPDLVHHASSETRIAYELLVSMVALGVFAWLCISVAPNLWQRGLMFVETQWLYVVAYGLLMLISFPVIGTTLIMTVVGAAIGVLMLVLWIGVMLLSQVLWVYWLGSRFLDSLSRKASLAMTLSVGVGVYGLLLSVSIIGTVVVVIALIMGSGGLWMAVGKTYTSSRKLKLL